MDLLLGHASKSIQDKYLAPLARAEITSAFCMTEPAPGAGADPSNLRTTARRDGDGWVIDGHKWFSTGGGDASFLLVMARTSDDPKFGATLFVVDRNAPGVEHVRDVPTMAPPILAHREAEMKFHGVRVGADAVLGAEGRGFELAQARLVPARLTHCMRWLGLSNRALEMCKAYVLTRESFGKTLAHHQLVQKKIAENAAAIHAGNLMTWRCATILDRGDAKAARPYSSIAKTHVARTLCQVLDDAIEMHVALGFSEDVPFFDVVPLRALRPHRRRPGRGPRGRRGARLPAREARPVGVSFLSCTATDTSPAGCRSSRGKRARSIACTSARSPCTGTRTAARTSSCRGRWRRRRSSHTRARPCRARAPQGGGASSQKVSPPPSTSASELSPGTGAWPRASATSCASITLAMRAAPAPRRSPRSSLGQWTNTRGVPRKSLRTRAVTPLTAKGLGSLARRRPTPLPGLSIM
jgi:hypothetical protein